MTLRLPKPDLQYVLLCDASYYGAGFVLMVEDYVKGNKNKEKKIYAPVAFGSQLFNTAQLKFSTYYKEFLGLYYALDEFSHYIWSSTQPVLVLTDNISLTHFFQSKTIPPSIWNFLDRVLSFNIVIAHIPGKANYAADFLSRVQTEKSASLTLKHVNQIPVKEIQVESEAKSPDVMITNINALSEDLPSETDNTYMISKLEALGLYETYLERKQRNQNDINELWKLSRAEVNQVQLPSSEDVLSDLLQKQDSLDLTREQSRDEDISQVIEWKNSGLPSDLKYASTRLKKYAKQFDRLKLENNVLYRLFYDDTGKILHQQICLPKHLWKEVIYRLHNSPTAGHLGILRTIQEFRKRFYYPGFTEHFIDFIKNCMTCLQLKRYPNKQLRPPLQPVSSLQSYPGEMMQIDLVQQNGPIFKYVLSGIDVFTKYLFAVPLTNGSADTVARELVKIFFQHSYLPKTLLSDLGTTFTSSLMAELARLLEVKLKHATLKHPQTIGVVERSHDPLKRILKLNTSEQWNDWHKYVPLATFIHNTSYHSSINCCPTTLFHGREPVKPLDLRFSRKGMEACEVNSDYVLALQDALLQKFGENKQKLLDSYQRYRNYYDQKSAAQPLRKHTHCLLLNPRLTTQRDFTQKSVQTWLPLYRVEQVLTNSNYIIRRVGTNYTQCVHRIRLRPLKLENPPEDLENVNPENFEADPSRRTTRNEPELFDDYIPNLIEDNQRAAFLAQNQKPPAMIKLSVVPVAAPVPIAAPPAVHAPPPAPIIPPRPGILPPPINYPSPQNSPHNTPSSSEQNSPVDLNAPQQFNLPPSPPEPAEAHQSQSQKELQPESEPGPSERRQKKINFSHTRKIRTYETWHPPARLTDMFKDPPLPESPSQPSILTRAEKRQIFTEAAQRLRRDPTSSRETKLDQVRASIQRYQQSTPEPPARNTRSQTKQRNSGKPGSLNSLLLRITAQFIKLRGNILHSYNSIVNCVSSDMLMSKGLAKMIAQMYPSMREIGKNQPKFPVGTVIPYFDSYTNR